MESTIVMNCTGFAENFTTIIESFQQIGWSVRNSYGEIEYLDKKDSDYFWKCDGMSDERFYEMISNKEKNEDQIGVNLFHRDGNEGISLNCRSADDPRQETSVCMRATLRGNRLICVLLLPLTKARPPRKKRSAGVVLLGGFLL